MKMLKAKEQYENRMSGPGFQRPATQKAIRKVIYPDSDGKRMSDDTRQFGWIVKIKENLERVFHDNPDVFIAGDLLWYPEEGNNKIRTAPDVMVAFGRPKGRRGSYRLWEENHIPPQVVFEILSHKNRHVALEKKFQFYQKYGVEEYYIYDSKRVRLSGWRRTEKILIPIANMNGWISPLLKIRFEIASDDLTIYCPDGTRFVSIVELDQIIKANYRRAEKAKEERQMAEAENQKAGTERQRAETERQRAEAEHQRAATGRQRAEAEHQRAATERQRAATERQRAETERQRAKSEHQRADAECREKERLAAKLRELGIEI